MELPKNNDEINLDNEINELISKPMNNLNQPRSYSNHGITIDRSNILLFPGGKIVALVSLGLLATILAKYDFTNANEITVSQSEELQKLIKIVATCENKSTNKIYTEIKSNYNIYNLKKIPESTYQNIKEELSLRKCEPPMTEAFLLHNTTNN